MRILGISAFYNDSAVALVVDGDIIAVARGEPIVCTASDSYTCFMRTNIDVLTLQNYVLNKVSAE